MQAVVQDKYGSAEVLRLALIPQPEIADNEVLVGVRAAGVHIGDEHSMTGQPYLMRVMGFGLRAPKARVRGMDVAGVVEAVGTNVTRFTVGDEVFGTCAGAFAEHAHPGRTSSQRSRQTSHSSRRQRYPPPPVPPCRRYATPEASSRGSRS